MAITLDGTTGITTPGLTNTGSLSIVNFTTSGNTILGDASTDTLNVGDGGLVKDASGNVGIGTASPSAKLSLSRAGSAGATNFSMGNDTDASGAIIQFIGSTFATTARQEALEFYMTGANNKQIFYTNATERMRIDSSGNLLVGTTSADPITSQVNGISLGSDQIIRACVNGVPAAAFSRRGTDGTLLAFHKNATAVGSISVSTSATAYNTSSDYRLKENIAPMVGALDTVAQLKPVTYNWKADGSDGQGFIAHELAEVVPDCVSGEKDATEEQEYEISPAIPAVLDEEGVEVTPAVEAVMGTRTVPVYQGIDTSFLVATLTAAIQELKAELDITKAKVAALESA